MAKFYYLNSEFNLFNSQNFITETELFRNSSNIITQFTYLKNKKYFKTRVLGGTMDVIENGCKIVKHISAKYLLEEELFRNEVYFLQAIKHKNIVNYIGFFMDPFIIVTELCECTLHDYICGCPENFETYKRTELIYFAKELLRGIEYLHERKIIHHDINDTNLLLVKNPETNYDLKSKYNLKIAVSLCS